jgi:predicted ATPase
MRSTNNVIDLLVLARSVLASKRTQTCKNIILTGPPGSGKTTLINRFRGLTKVVDEVARVVIEEWNRSDKWSSGKSIQDEIYKRSLKVVNKSIKDSEDEDFVLFDRTHLDCLAYGYIPKKPPEPIKNAEVWVLKFHRDWYNTDSERKETPEEAEEIGEKLKRAYKSLGYTVREIDAGDPSTWPSWARKRLSI